MFTIQQVADIFNVHYQTVRNWIADGFIKAMKYNGVVRISQEEIDRVKAGAKNDV